jgi:hypothetical protein
MAWLGFVEVAPLAASLVIGLTLKQGQSPVLWMTGGLLLSVLTCWLLRHQTPPTVIHFLNGASDPEGSGQAAPE